MMSVDMSDYIELFVNSVFCGVFLSVFRILCHLIAKVLNSVFAKKQALGKLKKITVILLSIIDFAFVFIASSLYMIICFISIDGLFSLYGALSLILSYIFMSVAIKKMQKYLNRKIKKQQKNE